jgi:hypothetical protein
MALMLVIWPLYKPRRPPPLHLHQPLLQVLRLQQRNKMSFTIQTITTNWIFIEDTGSGVSVTNDAEGVCDHLVFYHGNKRIMYRDSDGTWDELVHDHGIFKRFELHGLTDYDVITLKRPEAVTYNMPAGR